MASSVGSGITVPVADSSAPHNTVSETPAPIESLKPAASNSGVDDPTGGIDKSAGGLSSTAGISSPVTAEQEPQTYVGAAMEYVLGKKEKTAEEMEATGPTSAAVTTEPSAAQSSTPTTTTTASDTNSSGTYLGAITGAAAAGGAAIASTLGFGSASNTETAPASTQTEAPPTTIESSSATTGDKTIGGGLWTAEDGSAGVATTSSTGDDRTLGDKAAETAESAKTAAAETAESTKTAAAETAESAKTVATQATESAANTASSVAGQAKESAAAGDEKNADDSQDPEKAEKAKEVDEHIAAVRENKDSIPTAGGEKLGASHAGESKVIPEVPPLPKEDATNVSSSAGQPDSVTADNTAKNIGGAEQKQLPIHGGHHHEDSETSDKPKFMDRLKTKLHLEKKDKS